MPICNSNTNGYQCLYPLKFMFPLTPWVFGCVAFVYDLRPNLDKLAPRVIKCIFLDYTSLQKRYWCYVPTARQSYVSIDITFFRTLCISLSRVFPHLPHILLLHRALLFLFLYLFFIVHLLTLYLHPSSSSPLFPISPSKSSHTP